MNLLAETIHASIGEHRPTQHRFRFAKIHSGSEIPRADAFVPIATGVGDITVFFRGDNERKLPPVVGIAQRRLRRQRGAVRSRAPSPEHFVVDADDRDVCPLDSRSVIETGYENERVLRTVLYGDA